MRWPDQGEQVSEGGHGQACEGGDGQAHQDDLAFDGGYGRAQGDDGEFIGWNSAKKSEVQDMVVIYILQSDGDGVMGWNSAKEEIRVKK